MSRFSFTLFLKHGPNRGPELKGRGAESTATKIFLRKAMESSVQERLDVQFIVNNRTFDFVNFLNQIF